MLNCYPVPAAEGARARYVVRSVPGLADFSGVRGPFLRAMRRIEGKLYVAAAGGLHRIEESGVATFLAAIPDDPNTTLSGHRSAVVVASGGSYSVWSDDALTQPGDGRIGLVSSADFSDQYTLLFEQGGREIEWTELGDPLTRDALNFATAEARDDPNIRGIVSGAYVWVFKENSAEIWGVTSNGFARLPGAVVDIGLLRFNLVTEHPGGLFFIGSDRTAYLTEGAGVRPISTPPVAQALERETATHCFYYEDRGHRFCVIRFSDRPAWCFDLSTSMWHERATAGGAWEVVAAEFVYGRWHLGTATGRVYRATINPTDAGRPLRRVMTSRPAYQEGQRFVVSQVEFLGRFGQHAVEELGPQYLLTEDGAILEDEDGQPIILDGLALETTLRAPRICLRISRDGGVTFGLPKIQSLPVRGDHQMRCTFGPLGQFRNFAVEVSITDPVDIPMLSDANVRLA